jgi:hypothetical protein
MGEFERLGEFGRRKICVRVNLDDSIHGEFKNEKKHDEPSA